jgi:predicted DNA-binding antitoxin AbrB/MazE fold protein
MAKQVEAVYENGMLRPLEPLPLEEHQHVTVMITEARPTAERSQMDQDYLATVKAEVSALPRIPTLEEIHKITGKDPTSWADTILGEREERF